MKKDIIEHWELLLKEFKMEEDKLKHKSEIKMFFWYVITEPLRKIKKMFKTVDDTMTPEFLMYLFIIFGVALYIRNRNHPLWMGAALIVIVILLRSIWKRKKFINVYRKEHYEKLKSS